MKPKIDRNKKYTSNGNPVEYLHRAPEGWPEEFPWRGIVNGDALTWTDEGCFCADYANNPNNLVEVCEPLEVMVAVNCHGEPESVSCSTVEGWDAAFPQNAPHRLVKFREVIQ